MGLPVPVAPPDGAVAYVPGGNRGVGRVRMSRYEAVLRAAEMAKGDWSRLYPIARLPRVVDAVALLPRPT